MMKSKLLFIGGFLIVPVCVLGVAYQHSLAWVAFPQALVVMFLRQSQHGYDSLGAPGYPDLAIALLYYPLLGWIISRAGRKGTLQWVALRAAIWHIVAIGLAVFTAQARNRIWGF
jgi:hypothetical protein